jgi:hypothetical protein
MGFDKKKMNSLIEARISGRITPEDDELLDRMIAENEKVRLHYYQLINLEKQIQESKPPGENVDVAGPVMQEINTRQRATSAIAKHRISWETFLNPFPLHYAMIMIAGVLIGSVITWMLLPGQPQLNSDQLSGSMMTKPGHGMSFQQSDMNIKVVPYVIGSTWYLNFIVDAHREITVEVFFDPAVYVPVKSEYLIAEGSRSMDSSSGLISFKASAKTSFQMIFEKTIDEPVPITVKAFRDQVLLTSDQLFFD